MINRGLISFLLSMSLISILTAQTSTTGAEGNIITTAMSFLTISPDSRGAGMADVGAATTPDAGSVFWNPGKLVFNEKKIGGSISYTPWLRQLNVNDMWIGHVTGYLKPREFDAIGFHLTYFNLGEIQFTDVNGTATGKGTPKEFSTGFTYSRKLSDKFGLGIGLKLLYSGLADGASVAGTDDIKPAITAAGDIGVYYKTEYLVAGRAFDVSYGANLSNLGSKVSYTSDNNTAFIPTNLRLGTFWQTEVDAYHKIGLGLDLNKLLVPTPNGSNQDQSTLSGAFSSFADAPGGFSEEMSEITISTGAEYWYQDAFALRTGYFHESKDKGNRKYASVGAGLRRSDFGLDIAYLIPFVANSPLANTIRFTLLFNIE